MSQGWIFMMQDAVCFLQLQKEKEHFLPSLLLQFCCGFSSLKPGILLTGTERKKDGSEKHKNTLLERKGEE